MIGPSTADSPITGPKMPKAEPSSSVEKVARMMPRPCGISSAAANPCTNRNEISIGVPVANPQASDASTKPNAPMTNNRLRP